MRLPTFDADYWELRSAERSAAESPDFRIPPLDARRSLNRGDAAKLIFDIEGYDENGKIVVGGERMWVIGSERVGDQYIGILDNKPSLDASDDVYLVFGAEIPFGPEHVIDIRHPPKDYQDWQLSQPPERKWPRA